MYLNVGECVRKEDLNMKVVMEIMKLLGKGVSQVLIWLGKVLEGGK